MKVIQMKSPNNGGHRTSVKRNKEKINTLKIQLWEEVFHIYFGP